MEGELFFFFYRYYYWCCFIFFDYFIVLLYNYSGLSCWFHWIMIIFIYRFVLYRIFVE